MKTRTRRSKSASIEQTRWIAYAAAGAATALGGSHSAEAAVHYSGPINHVFRGHTNGFAFFSLASGLGIEFQHFSTANGGYAGFAVYSVNESYRAVRGYRTSRGVLASKLGFGENISAGPFSVSTTSYFAIMASNNHGVWQDRGVGFVGFKFKGRGGVPRYGWARVNMAGSPGKVFKLLDYAFADPGEPIFAGQRSSDEQAPDQGSTNEQALDEGSLGGLALGAVGLLAWRKRRSRSAQYSMPPMPL